MKRKLLRKMFYFYYNLFENLNVFEVAKKRGIEIDCIIEAGCHDGTDTILLEEFFKPRKYLAFEPDATARNRAVALLEQHNKPLIQVFDFGLSDKDSLGFLKYEAEGAGSGSSHFRNSGEEPVEVRAFDEYFQINNHKGLLWLDVEGHTTQALLGMQAALGNIFLARIEVQLHTRSEDFKQDYEKVLKLMKEASLVPIYGPIHPGFFGDLIFIKSTDAGIFDRARSKLLL
jgi:FkbM family methyltransferase